MTLFDKLKPYQMDLLADADAGNMLAKRIINLYRLHRDCPSDPGAPALCEAAFAEWLKERGS